MSEQATCYTDGRLTICVPAQGVVRRRVLNCPVCERRTRFVQRFTNPWYSDSFTCCSCGDSWADGERRERPWLRGWRPKAIAEARTAWAAAMTAAPPVPFLSTAQEESNE